MKLSGIFYGISMGILIIYFGNVWECFLPVSTFFGGSIMDKLWIIKVHQGKSIRNKPVFKGTTEGFEKCEKCSNELS